MQVKLFSDNNGQWSPVGELAMETLPLPGMILVLVNGRWKVRGDLATAFHQMSGKYQVPVSPFAPKEVVVSPPASSWPPPGDAPSKS